TSKGSTMSDQTGTAGPVCEPKPGEEARLLWAASVATYTAAKMLERAAHALREADKVTNLPEEAEWEMVTVDSRASDLAKTCEALEKQYYALIEKEKNNVR
ncbi:hypothetical protein, partial [Corynebacterium pygosceleis]|uniref:hypothetical protein n=1 Tax=Corynebacterium pygosceleis TaxID=2800406 RepID=UPI002002F2D2